MGWSLRIARVAGTDIKLHVTFLLLLGFFFLAGGAAAGILLLAIFFCVLLHEFGHIAMARRFGVRTPDVILLPIGGVARLERMPEEPHQEFLIALAGPFVTLVLAIVFYAILAAQGASPPLIAGLEVEPGRSLTAELYHINVLLLLFNLLPAFPMDGGRVLRALLSSRLGIVRATRIAASVGQMAAFVLGFYALTQRPVQVLLLLIAFFVFVGAGGEAEAVATRAAGKGLVVRDMMVTDFRTLPVFATLSDAADLLIAGDQSEFPVVDNLGKYEGILTREDLVRGLSASGPAGLVRDAMSTALPLIDPGVAFERALQTLNASRQPAIPVLEEGRLVGLLTKDNISDLVLVRRAAGSRVVG